MSNPVQQLLNAEKRAAVIVNDARARKYAFSLIAWLLWLQRGCDNYRKLTESGISARDSCSPNSFFDHEWVSIAITLTLAVYPAPNPTPKP